MTGDESGDIVEQVTREGDLSLQWPEVTDKDRDNIRRWLRRRRKGGENDMTLRYEWGVLVRLAVRVADGPLSSERLHNFEEPDNRPGRVLVHFLMFVGAESPPCRRCGERDYQPAEESPEEMRCNGCGFLYDDSELAQMAYNHGV